MVCPSSLIRTESAWIEEVCPDVRLYRQTGLIGPPLMQLSIMTVLPSPERNASPGRPAEGCSMRLPFLDQIFTPFGVMIAKLPLLARAFRFIVVPTTTPE